MSLCRSIKPCSSSLTLSSHGPQIINAFGVRYRSVVAAKKRAAKLKAKAAAFAPAWQTRGRISNKVGSTSYTSPEEDYHDKPLTVPDIGKNPSLIIPPSPLTPDSPTSKVLSFFEENARRWAKQPRVKKRLASFGVHANYLRKILDAFTSDVAAGRVRYDDADPAGPFTAIRDMTGAQKREIDERGQDALGFNLAAFARSEVGDGIDSYMDLVYTNVLYAWARSPIARTHTQSEATFPASVLEQMTALSTAVAAPTPALYQGARTLKRRFILHVGPTNSGKTHAALRALAAAPTGVYAGPLRLLAHEIWERLNMGTIVPKGVDESQIQDEEVAGEEDTNLDASGKAIIKKGLGKRQWVRETNMITGEEVKSVSPCAQLISCTVEMINFATVYDVGVIDEIQLLSDPERGFAWTAAVLGLNAAEIHLCGEATAIPLIRTLVESCGDSLEINEYTRLSPLVVEDKSLENDLSRVQAGDCIVAFSRSGIFRLKTELEEKGLRVASIYGRLPPEVRSEQADRFNTGKADVLVGSDALGLGLNLKIRRMIFSQMAKVHAGSKGQWTPLSISQVKQIAGRAGRYGLHSPAPTPKAGDTPSENTPPQPTSTVGAVTTMNQGDLDFLRRTMELTPAPLTSAKLSPSIETVQMAMRVLSKASVNYTLPLIMNVHRYAAQCPSHMRYGGFENSESNWDKVTLFMDSNGLGLGKIPLDVTMLSFVAPLPIRDVQSHAYLRSLFMRFITDLVVPVEAALKDGLEGSYGFVEYLAAAEVALGFPGASCDVHVSLPTGKELLSTLETMNSCLSLYAWMHYRRPTSFPDLRRVQEDLLPRTRNAIEGILAGGLSKRRRGSDYGVYGEKEGKVKFERNVLLKGRQLELRDELYSGLRENIKQKQQQHRH